MTLFRFSRIAPLAVPPKSYDSHAQLRRSVRASFSPSWGHANKEVYMNHIILGHVRAFQAVRSPLYDNITVTSCLINAEPAVDIVLVDNVGESGIAVMPSSSRSRQI